jgi:hypothetical protein
MTIAPIELPQRYQLVNETSPLAAGVRLLAFGVPFPVGLVMGSFLTGRLRIPFFLTLLFGTVLQIVGFALLSTIPSTVHLWPGQFGYSVIAGLGVGISAGTYYLMTPISCDKKEQRKLPHSMHCLPSCPPFF